MRTTLGNYPDPRKEMTYRHFLYQENNNLKHSERAQEEQ